MRILDLFCGAGGAAMGYHRAFPDAEIIGVDIAPQPHYPFLFQKGDALQILALSTFVHHHFDLVHASPPCQRFSDLAKRNRNADAWPDLIEPTRQLLHQADVPYVIENVEGAPLHDPIVFCGTMFPGLRVLRHRLFETTFAAAMGIDWMTGPELNEAVPPAYTQWIGEQFAAAIEKEAAA